MKKNTQNLLLGGAAFTAVAANAILLIANNLKASNQTSPSTISASAGSESTPTTSSETSQTGSESSSTTGLKNGTYTGAVTATDRGDYQVQITVANGQISTIDVLEYPTENARSQQINADALPVYTKEAISKQSADVQLISGASEAFKGFTGSLQDAINQANA
ncbi:FMN-binding protein [Streptococcus sp. DD13]|uniref:FMN-binding protein n=1 Tax=Streptococcus sp. DD13 TaxID=1777881 RepID=UPI00079B48C5|nr:FMN-binding protein [Streptococcus sp. DD13]KXT78166.1 hypothetical protein STRDD13_00991 [Streptococcus sp. DD13]